MTTAEKILKVLNDNKETAMFGSDGDYDTFFALYEEDFNIVTNKIIEILNLKK